MQMPYPERARDIANAWLVANVLPPFERQRLARQRDMLGLLGWHRSSWRRQEQQFKLECRVSSTPVSATTSPSELAFRERFPGLATINFDFAESFPLGHGPIETDDRFRRMGRVALFGLTAWLPGARAGLVGSVPSSR